MYIENVLESLGDGLARFITDAVNDIRDSFTEFRQLVDRLCDNIQRAPNGNAEQMHVQELLQASENTFRNATETNAKRKRNFLLLIFLKNKLKSGNECATILCHELLEQLMQIERMSRRQKQKIFSDVQNIMNWSGWTIDRLFDRSIGGNSDQLSLIRMDQ